MEITIKVVFSLHLRAFFLKIPRFSNEWRIEVKTAKCLSQSFAFVNFVVARIIGGRNIFDCSIMEKPRWQLLFWLRLDNFQVFILNKFVLRALMECASQFLFQLYSLIICFFNSRAICFGCLLFYLFKLYRWLALSMLAMRVKFIDLHDVPLYLFRQLFYLGLEYLRNFHSGIIIVTLKRMAPWLRLLLARFKEWYLLFFENPFIILKDFSLCDFRDLIFLIQYQLLNSKRVWRHSNVLIFAWSKNNLYSVTFPLELFGTLVVKIILVGVDLVDGSREFCHKIRMRLMLQLFFWFILSLLLDGILKSTPINLLNGRCNINWYLHAHVEEW